MKIEVVGASLFDANCYEMWLEGSKDALVVDPGPGTAEGVREVLESQDLAVGAVLLTHGHIDHVWQCATVSAEFSFVSLAQVNRPSPCDASESATFCRSHGFLSTF